jgi:hypothetical protein
LRRTYRAPGVEPAADAYFRGPAHPSVFDSAGLDVPAMLQLAHEMSPETLPPQVRIRVLEESQLQPGLDDSAAAPERLFDTPCAIARVHRTLAFQRRMVISAKESLDPRGRPLTYRWVILRGDPALISLQPLDAEASAVEIRIGWHERRPVHTGAALLSNRVDLGVFVSNGVQDSAPAFVTTYFPSTAKRVYDGNRRIASLDGTEIDPQKVYTDPLIDGRRNWRDEFSYDEYGVCTGWVRKIGGERQSFGPDGRIIAGRDGAKVPTKAVSYRIRVAGESESASVEVEPRVEVESGGTDGSR